MAHIGRLGSGSISFTPEVENFTVQLLLILWILGVQETCPPIKLPKESLKVEFRTFTFQDRRLAKRQQLRHTIIWKEELAFNSVNFNPEKGQALGRINNFCPVDGKAKGLQ